VGGVEAFDVEGGVGFGIAQALGVHQAGLEGQAFEFHAGEDVVAGAVENARQPRDAVAGERLAQRLDHRDAAGRRGLESQRDALLSAVMGKQRLVGSDHRFAGGERSLDGGFGWTVRSADEFDQAIDLGRSRQFDGIVEPGQPGEIDAAVAVAITRADGGDADGAATAQTQRIVLTPQDAKDRCADRAKPGEADPERGRGCLGMRRRHGRGVA